MSSFVLPFATNEFMLNALLAGLLTSVACGIVGTFMVLRGLAFMGDALAHGILPGVAAALLLGIPGIIGAGAGALVMIGGVSLVTKRSRLSADTAIGLLFVAMLSLGVLIVSRSNSFSGDLVSVMFGEILGIGAQDLIIQSIATVLLVAVTFLFRRPFLMLCFSQDQAQVSGYRARLYHGLMLFMIALTVIVSFQTVGTMLVFGMLLAPAATAALFSRSLGKMMLTASVIGAVSVYLGLLLSYHLDLAAGAAMVMVAAIVFFASLGISGLIRVLLARSKNASGAAR